MRYFFIFLLLLQGCSEAIASLPRGRPGKGALIKGTGGEVADSLSAPFTDWLWYFDGSNQGASVTDPWTNDGGTDSVSLDQSGSSAGTGNQSTSGLTTSGIGASRENKAVLLGPFNDCYVDAAATSISALGPDIHIRLLIDPLTIATNEWFSDYAGGVDDEFRIYHPSTSQLRFRISNGVSENYDVSANITANTWSLVDIIHDANGGATGKALTTICINGTCTEGSEAVNTGLGIASGGGLSMGDFISCGVPWHGEMLFYGLRNSISDIDETAHDTHCAAIGTC